MKLTLKEKRGIHVLEVQDEVDARGLKVLIAGVSKLFKNGKNRMILSFRGKTKTPPSFPEEMFSLTTLAQELSGQIVFCGLPEAEETKLLSYKTPPEMKCAKTLPLALGLFDKVRDSEEAEPNETKGEDLSEEVAKLRRENKRLLAALELSEKGTDAGPLREDNTKLQEQIKLLTDKVAQLCTPPKGEATDKLQAFEQQIQDLTEQLKTAKA